MSTGENSELLLSAPRRRQARVRLSRWLVAVACLAASLLPASGAGAAEEPDSAGGSNSNDSEMSAESWPDDSPGRVDIVRYDSSDPYAMSIELAEALAEARGGASEWVVLASGESWADAALAGPLAASLGSPVLLVPPGGLQTSAARPDLAEFLRSAGVRRAVIVGDPEVLPNHEPSVLYGLGMLPRNIERVHGDDPVGTSIAVAERIGAPVEFGELGRTVSIASHRSVADAVAVGPLAASGPFPLLLTAPDTLDPRIATYLEANDVAHVVLVGGTAAIAPEVHDAIGAVGVTVSRLAGRDRSDTARLAADLFNRHTANDPNCIDDPLRIGLAPARHPEQALTVGNLLAELCTPLRFTEPDQLPTDLRNTLYLADNGGTPHEVHVFADDRQMPMSSLDVIAPPALIALASSWPRGHPRYGEPAAVVIADEMGEWRRYAAGSPAVTVDPGEFQAGGGEVFEWSPDGRYLAHVDGTRLFVADTVTHEMHEADFGDLEVTFSIWHRPVWSPDGTRLAISAFTNDDSTCLNMDCGYHPFQTSTTHTAEIFVFDMHDQSVRRLTYNATSDEVVAWSPDGTSLAFTQASVDIGLFSAYWFTTPLAIVDIDTGSMTELHGWAQVPVRDYVAWAPDGLRLAFIGTVAEDSPYDPYDQRVFVVNRDGSGLTQLTEEGPWGWILGWDDSGRQLLYTSHDPSNRGESERRIWDAVTGTVAVLDLDHLGQGSLRGWSRVSGKVLYRVGETWSSYEPLLRVDLDSRETEQLLNARIEGRWPSSPEVLGLSGDERQMAAIIDEDRLVIYSDAYPQGRSIIDFPDNIFWDPNGSCWGMWTASGIRGGCEYWRDV